MPEMIWQDILTQIGPESTAGTAVAATHQFADYALLDAPHIDTYPFSPPGHIWQVASARGKGWSEFKPSGDAGYNGVAYPLSSLFGAATITAATGGVTSKQWKWTPSITNLALGQTYTIERGSATRARKYAYGFFDALKLNYTKTDISIDGHGFGREIQDGITLTSLTAAAIIPSFPLRGTDTNLYIDTTSGGIGTTQYTRVGAMSIDMSGFFQPWYGIDRTQVSFSTVAPMKPKFEVKFRLMSDVNGMGIFTNYVQTGATAYIRFDTLGPIADGTAHFQMTYDMALKVTAPSDFTEDGGLEVIEFTGQLAEDAAWGSGQAVVITLINMIAAL